MPQLRIPQAAPVYATPAPVFMDSRQQLADLAAVTGRSFTKAITFDAYSGTYGCQISESRLTTTGIIQQYVIAEVRGQPDRAAAERAACQQAVQSFNVTSVNMAIAQYR